MPRKRGVIVTEPDNVAAITRLPIPLENFEDPIWEYHPELGETEDYYKGFLLYAALPPSQRSMQEAWEQWTQRGTRASGTFVEVCRVYQWARRASAWDIAKIKTSQTDWIARDEQRREADFKMGELLRTIARESLEAMQDNGGTITPGQAARLVGLASELQQRAIPSTALEGDEIKQVLNALPEERKKSIIGILIARSG